MRSSKSDSWSKANDWLTFNSMLRMESKGKWGQDFLQAGDVMKLSYQVTPSWVFSASILSTIHDICMYIFLDFSSRMAKLELASNLVLFHSLKLGKKKKKPSDISSFTHGISQFFLAKRQKPICKKVSNVLTWNVYLSLLLPFYFTPVNVNLTAAVQRYRIVVTCHLHFFICQNSDGCNIKSFSWLIFKNI